MAFRAPAHGRLWSGLLALLLVCCVATLSPTQRQQLETRVYAAPYDRTFAATRDAFVNRGYLIAGSDFEGGVLTVSTSVLARNPNTALGLSVVAPFGDAYMNRWGWALFDTIFVFFAWAWAMPSNYMLARNRWKEIEGNVALEEVGPERTRLRISLHGVAYDANEYPVVIRTLQEEIERQVFIKKGDTLGGEPQ